MTWSIKSTETFLLAFQKLPPNPLLLRELEKRLHRLKKNPYHVGGWLHGPLHGKRSTRLAQKYRLIFTVDEDLHIVYLVFIDHRKDVYRTK